MAGLGSRFSKSVYQVPKPLISINGKPMIQLVIENLRPREDHRFIFVCQEEHLALYNLKDILHSVTEFPEIISVNKVTEGPACTALLSKIFINNDEELMIANCDQYIEISIDEYLFKIRENKYDGCIMTMSSNDPKWSYVKFNQLGLVTEVAEKVVISNEATVGIYNFSKGKDFVNCAEKMIFDNERVNNEFYVAPVYNYMIRNSKDIGFLNIGSERNGMYGLGVPEDLDFFIKSKC